MDERIEERGKKGIWKQRKREIGEKKEWWSAQRQMTCKTPGGGKLQSSSLICSHDWPSCCTWKCSSCSLSLSFSLAQTHFEKGQADYFQILHSRMARLWTICDTGRKKKKTGLCHVWFLFRQQIAALSPLLTSEASTSWLCVRSMNISIKGQPLEKIGLHQ